MGRAGAAAIENVTAGGISVLVLDLGLPDIDGLDVMRDLIARGLAVPTVVVTARTDPTDRAAALALGANRYLTKPFAWAELLARRAGLQRRPRLNVGRRRRSAEGDDQLGWVVGRLLPSVELLLHATVVLGGIPDEEAVVGTGVHRLQLCRHDPFPPTRT